MKYSKTKTYYTILDDSTRQVKFVRTLTEKHTSYCGNKREYTRDIFSLTEYGLSKEVELSYVYESYEVACLNLRVERLEEENGKPKKKWFNF
jgi:hypothetical protein